MAVSNFDFTDLNNVINQLENLVVEAPAALADTLNYGTELAIDAAEEAIVTELNLDADYVRSKISVSQRATPRNFTAVIRAKKRGLLLPRYDAKALANRGGVSWKIKRNKARSVNESAFFIKLKRGAQSGAGAMAVAYRPKDGKGKNSEHQQQIDSRGYAVMHSVSVSQALETLSPNIEIDNQSLISFFLQRINNK